MCVPDDRSGAGNRGHDLSLAMTATKENGSQSSAPPPESEPLSTDTPPPNSSSEHASSSSSSPPPPTPDRAELVDRARHFLSSPQVIHQDYESKRRFLAEKGLEDGEIQLLLREMVSRMPSFYPPQTHVYVPAEQHSQFPVVPPRMYPAPPPSRLPGLLVGTFKVLSWLAGGSTALLFIYYVRTLHILSHLFYHRSDRAHLWPTSDSCFHALRGQRLPVARSRHTRASFSPG